jgi:glucose 1-dehydrogenase
MMFRDKAVVITGAGQGIGLEIAKRLLSEGSRIILNDVDEGLCASVAAQMGDRVIAVPGNSASAETIDEMIATAVKEFGKVDIAIANAGITHFGDFFSYSREAFHRVMEVNLAGSFFLAQAAAQQMRSQGHGGSILFTSSVTGTQAHKNLAAYAMSKAALQMLARNLVIELSPYNINVNAVAPGATVTERTMSTEPDYESTWSNLTPMQRPAYVSDIANAALFLVSDPSRHITGQTIIVDGGWTCVSPSVY